MPGADRELFRASRPARLHLITSIVLGLLTAVLIVVQATLLARVVDHIAFGGAGAADVQDDVLLLIAAALGRGLLAASFETSGRYGAARAMADLRARLCEHVLRVRPGDLSGERAGELAATAVQGVDALEAYFARYLPQAVLAMAVPVAIIVVVLPLDAVAALIMAVTIPVIVLFMILIGKGAAAHTRARWASLSRLSAHFLDVVEGLTTLRANDRAAAQETTIASVGEEYRRETMGTLRIAFLSAFVLELAAMIGTALVAATIGVQLVNGSLHFTAGLTVLLLAPELYLPVRQLGAQFHASADGLAASERIFAVLRTPPALAAPTATIALTAPDPRVGAVALHGAGFAYPGRTEPALDDVDLQIAPGETVALVGPSGAGKSTLAALAVRLTDPTSGSISCDGVDLRDVDPDAWRARCAWVPQRATLFAGTVADNIRLADPGASDERVRAAAGEAEALTTIEGLPEGFATAVGEGGRRLSAGETQRIALARAFLTDAPFVVLDEPTANLDEETAAAVSTAIERLCRDRTALLVVHRSALAALADRTVRMDSGRIVNAVPDDRA